MPEAIEVRVEAVAGSAPRAEGTTLIVQPDRIEGTIGGGVLEYRGIERARAILAGQASMDPLTLSLGPETGQCCGGVVTLGFRAVPMGCAPSPYPQTWPLLIYGAGHVGQALLRATRTLPFERHWADARPDYRAAAAGLEATGGDDPEHLAATGPAGALHVIVTHDHALDLALCDRLLDRNDFRYLGVIGSRSKRAKFLKALARRGHRAEVRQGLTCPIGLPGITGKEPPVIAAAVVAELLLVVSSASASFATLATETADRHD